MLEFSNYKKEIRINYDKMMNLGDPELELIDPTPNVHSMFLHFDKLFFWTKLASRAVVRWSKRMYSCAGICSYDRGGLCDIALSEPLLKLRPRKDLVETLLHEMIHAYLFITCRDQDRDGHGPNFKAHMHRINKAAGLNISIYHDFHDEVQLYQTHWWRCNGPCQTKKPYFGIVRRTMNKAPGPSDCWWKSHQRNCGGTFVKIKEPEKQSQNKKKSAKPNADITKYINNNNNVKNKNIVQNDKTVKPVLKDSNNLPVNSNVITKINNSSTVVVSKKNNIVFNPQATKPPDVFSGQGQTLSGRKRTSSVDVTETVRNVWANKQIPSIFPDKKDKKAKEVPKRNSISNVNTNPIITKKHKTDSEIMSSPPTKMKKIDDYFKSSATSVLKDLYGQDFIIKEDNKNSSNKRLSVVPVQEDLVDCPICSIKISSTDINRHLDECLNKDVIEKLCKDPETKPVIPIKTENVDSKNNNFISRTNMKDRDTNHEVFSQVKKESSEITIKTEPNNLFDLNNFKKHVKTEDIKINTHLDVGNKQIIKTEKPDNRYIDTKLSTVKTEPGTSKETIILNEQECPCCGKIITKPMNEHLDECLAFFGNDVTIPDEGASTSFANETILIEDDDEDDKFDETLTFNATGTKSPCPCCLKMIEQADMNDHLDICLS